MKFPLSLLKRFLITEAPLEEILVTLTAIGLEVDGVDDKAAELKPFVVAEILHAERHPQADKLQVCRVHTANGELQIVCGAPNARAGIKVALANIGTIIPTNGMEIKKAAVRGVESQGMLCSGAELGLSTDSAGIIELPLDAAIGASIVDVLHLNDPVIDINVTANRGDCMGVLGVARDLAAAGLGTFKAPCVPSVKAHGACPVNITIEDTDGCPAFLGRVIRGVKNGPSPDWLQRALTAAGMRPISALVDITNYFSLAFGRPLHVYDLAKFDGSIVVRRAREGEQLAALNEKTYSLAPRDCVVADGQKALGLGGVMGGAETGVTETTTDVLLEVALFNPLRIAQTGRALQIDSDARSRFERGVDAGFLAIADVRATELILELCGGEATDRVLAGDVPEARQRVPFDADFTNQLGGTDISASAQKKILTALGFTADGTDMIVPGWRHDISGKADLAEEVLRITGYDHIPAVSLPKHPSINRPALVPQQSREALLRRVAAARGLHETYSWGFCSQAQAAMFGGQPEALTLLNPISEALSVMRPHVLPHLLDSVRENIARGQADIAMFELGATFQDVSPTGQRAMLVGVRVGSSTGLHWAGSKAIDMYDVKADAMALLDAAGVDAAKATVLPLKDVPWFHPGRSGSLGLGPKNTLAQFGQIHPAITAQLGIDVPVFACVLFVHALPAVKPAKRKPITVSDFQPVTRDFAFVVDAATPAAELVVAVNKAEKSLLRDVTVFDVYAGKGVPEGKKSIALSVTLQAADRTLTDAEIETVSQAIVASAMKSGATLRA
ncbi:MAG: phenylalanine--tRNA ligase subunit beta [Azospirillum brasilense]|nr:MAG: phenylalanine--tRNA ligase subunit beta [Azospirillum brasilense]